MKPPTFAENTRKIKQQAKALKTAGPEIAEALRLALKDLEWCKAVYGSDWPAGCELRGNIMGYRNTLSKYGIAT